MGVTADLNGMAVFAKVVDAGSFTAAAEALGVSKSAVSKQITALEDRLGARLLNRTTRKLSLTEVGRAFYDRAARVVAEAEEAELAVTRLEAAPRGTLKVNAPMSFGIKHMAAVLPDLLNRYAELSVDLQLNDRVVDLMDEGFDVGVRITAMPDSSLIARKLAPVRRLVVGAPAYFEKHGRPRVPEDLKAHVCLHYSLLPTAEDWRFLDGGGNFHTVRITPRASANNGDVLGGAVKAGLGVALQPDFLCWEDIERGELEAVLTDYCYPDLTLHVIYHHNRHLSAKIRTFVDVMAAHFSTRKAPWVSVALPG